MLIVLLNRINYDLTYFPYKFSCRLFASQWSNFYTNEQFKWNWTSANWYHGVEPYVRQWAQWAQCAHWAQWVQGATWARGHRQVRPRPTYFFIHLKRTPDAIDHVYTDNYISGVHVDFHWISATYLYDIRTRRIIRGPIRHLAVSIWVTHFGFAIRYGVCKLSHTFRF